MKTIMTVAITLLALSVWQLGHPEWALMFIPVVVAVGPWFKEKEWEK